MNYTIASLHRLDESQQALYLGSLEELDDNAEDIVFRTYDLLFSQFPILKNLLSEDRFSHPDLSCLLANDEQNFEQGVKTLEYLILLTSTDASRIKKNKLLSQIHKCIIQAVRDVMFIEASRELVGIYAKLLDERLRQSKLVSGKRRRC